MIAAFTISEVSMFARSRRARWRGAK